MRLTHILRGTVILTFLLSSHVLAQDGNWNITNREAPQLAAMAATPGVVALTGDFNTDGRDDIALLRRASGWTTVPIAFAQGDGSWNITNRDAGAFAGWATESGVMPLTGDFNNDGLDDIALLRRASGWASVPIAFTQSDGSWNITNREAPQFAAMAATPGVVPLIGDFNTDGQDDIALVRQTGGWTTVPIALAQGDGSWIITNGQVGNFAAMAAMPGVIPLIGDFNIDERDDIALLRQTAGWNTVPIAFAQGNGGWSITSQAVSNFAAMAATPGVVPMTRGVVPLTGRCSFGDPALSFGCRLPDFNNDGLDDIALLRRGGGWNTVPVAFAQNNGQWSITNREVGPFAAMAATPGVVPLTGDFNNDGRDDIALLRQSGGWNTVPVAFAQGDGNWNITNGGVGTFAAMAAIPGVVPLIGDFNNDGQDDIALVRRTSGWASVPIAFADTGKVSILTLNVAGLEPKGVAGVKWQERLRRVAAWAAAETSAPDVIALTELWGWWWSAVPGTTPVGDYDAVDTLIYELQKQVHVVYRIAYMTGTMGWGLPNREYWTQAVLYNPTRLINLTPRDLDKSPLVAHDSRDAVAYTPHLRRSLPLCNRGTSYMPLEGLIDGPLQAEKCGQPTRTGPAWAVLWKGDGYDGLLASYARFELKGIPGRTLDIYVVHLRTPPVEASAVTANAFYAAMEGSSSPLRRYPPLVSGDFNAASPLNPKFDPTYVASSPANPADPGEPRPDDWIGTSIGRSDVFASQCRPRFAIKRTVPNLSPGMHCGGPAELLVSDHCAAFVSIEPDGAGACN